MSVLSTMDAPGVIPLATTNMAEAYENAPDTGQELILNFSIFLVNYLSYSPHLLYAESQAKKHPFAMTALLKAHRYLLEISKVDEREIFRICMEYWLSFLKEVWEEMVALPVNELGLGLAGFGLGLRPKSMDDDDDDILNHSLDIQSSGLGLGKRKDIYMEILSELRYVVIERMVKPEEVLIMEDESGEIVRERMTNTETIALYKSQRDMLVYLTRLDEDDMEDIFSEKLDILMNGKEWSWGNLNSLCWAVGSVSGCMGGYLCFSGFWRTLLDSCFWYR
jgi:exportin-1